MTAVRHTDSREFAAMEAEELLRLYKETGDEQVKWEIVLRYEHVVKHAALQVRGIYSGFAQIEDIINEGLITLLKAIDKFDLSFDVKFSTYAVPLITGEMKRFLRDDGMVKVSRTLKEQAMRLKLLRQKLQGEWNREPTLQELAEQSGLTMEEIVMATEAESKVESIYASVYQNDGSEVALVDMLGKEDEEKEGLLNHMLLKQLLEGLTEKESKLIEMRYFQEKTQTEVARHMGISQVQVSRLEKKILLSMRKRAEGKVC